MMICIHPIKTTFFLSIVMKQQFSCERISMMLSGTSEDFQIYTIFG